LCATVKMNKVFAARANFLSLSRSALRRSLGRAPVAIGSQQQVALLEAIRPHKTEVRVFCCSPHPNTKP
jgi:hypothetical protein